MNRTYERLSEELDQIPIIDVHSHIDINRPQAKDIGDILFYHFLRMEFLSVGGNDEFLVSGRPLEERVKYFLKYLPMMKNTATYWCARKIIRDLYGLEVDLNEENWRDVNRRIIKTSDDNSWPEVLLTKRLKVKRCFCCIENLSERQKGRFESRQAFLPHLEAFSFGPNYLSNLMSFIRRDDGSFPDNLRSALDRFDELIDHNMKMGIKSFGSAIDADFTTLPTRDESTEEAYSDYALGKALSLEEKHNLVTVFLYRFLEKIKERGVVQWYLGAEWKFGGRKVDYGYGESYVRVNHQLTHNLIKAFKDFPNVKFNLMYCAKSLSQELTIIARMLHNVSLLGFWWHSLFPSYIEGMLSERIEVLPANKWILVGTDAYTCEWCYGKIALVKGCLARVLERKIEQGYLTIEDAKFLASRILYENASEIYNVKL